jgi:hypothetical protein
MLPYSASRGPTGAVEHSLGKGEVESSIPPGSGSKLIRDGTRSPIANLPNKIYNDQERERTGDADSA